MNSKYVRLVADVALITCFDRGSCQERCGINFDWFFNSYTNIYRQSKNIKEIVDEFDEYLSFSVCGGLSLQKYNVSFIPELLKDEYSEICTNQGVDLIFDNLHGFKHSVFGYFIALIY